MTDAVSEPATLSTTGEAYFARLSEIAGDASRRVFAVIDGSRFDDVTGLLRAADISHRPLYRHAGGDFDVVRGGPWFVDTYRSSMPDAFLDESLPLDEGEADLSDEALQLRSAELSARMAAALDAGDATGGGMLPGTGVVDAQAVIARLHRLLSITDGRPAIVFWVGDESLTAERIYRHLRGINQIVMPRRDGADPPQGGQPHLEAADMGDVDGDVSSPDNGLQETMVFRHADPNVMMQVFPALDERQALRLFGPAEQIFFAPDAIWGGGIKRGRRPASGEVPRGSLHLSSEMIAMIEDARMQASRRKVAAYLRDVHPVTQELTEKDMMEHVLSCEASGTRLGLASERAHMKWAYLVSITEGGVHAPEAEMFFRQNAKHPDDAIDDLLAAFDKAAGDDWQGFWGESG